MKKMKYLLTAIAVLTFIAACSIGAVLGIFGLAPVYIFLSGAAIGLLGCYVYKEVTLLYLAIRFQNL